MGRAVGVVLSLAMVFAGLAAPAQARASQPPAAADTTAQLHAVSCISADSCWAVGSDIHGGITERWDGSSWRAVPSPNPPDATFIGFDSVACAQATSCWAVGDYIFANSERRPLIEHWNGQAWSEVTIPLPPHLAFPRQITVNAVSCPAANLCFVVGSYSRTGTRGVRGTSLIERWDGSSWQVIPRPVLVDGSETAIEGLSCAAATACWAVGGWIWDRGASSYKNGAFGYRWNGQRWTAQRIGPAVRSVEGRARVLYAVACATSQMCMATGDRFTNNPGQLYPLAQRWDGSGWAAAPFGLSTSGVGFPSAVSCATPQMCMAVGYSSVTTSSTIERWNGSSWSLVRSPSLGGAELYGVTCLRVNDCWAVGLWGNGKTGGALFERWNGKSWTVVPS